MPLPRISTGNRFYPVDALHALQWRLPLASGPSSCFPQRNIYASTLCQTTLSGKGSLSIGQILSNTFFWQLTRPWPDRRRSQPCADSSPAGIQEGGSSRRRTRIGHPRRSGFKERGSRQRARLFRTGLISLVQFMCFSDSAAAAILLTMSQCAWAFAASVLLPAAAPQLLFFLLVSFIPLFRAPDLSAFGYDYSRMHELPYGNHGDHTSRRLLPVLPLREPGLLSRGQ